MDTTEKLGLKMPESTDSGAIADLNYNAGILDTEVSARIKTINGESADPDTGNYNINEVPYARQLITEDMQRANGDVLIRSTGGGAPITSGNYKMVSLQGKIVHEGYVQEYLSWNIVSTSDTPITATIDRDTWVGVYDHTNPSIEFIYSSGSWSLDSTTVTLATYGITVTGTPTANDKIVVTYVKEERGTIYVPKFTKFVSTGWNLYDHDKGYARVPKYSSTYGFMAGEYSALQFSTTEDGEKSNLYPDSTGHFTIPSDGYVWVVGGNGTSTYVLMTWSDWTDGYPGGWSAYTENEVDLSYVMQRFPNGLLRVEDTYDEVLFSYPEGGGNPTATAYSRIGRMAYSEENLETAESNYTTYGLPYEYDTNFIYYVKQSPTSYTDIAVTGTFTADDHGMEFLYMSANEEVDAPIYAIIDYPQNLVSKLRMDVATLSEQTLADTQKAQVRTNIGAASQTEVSGLGYYFPDYSRILDPEGSTANKTLNYTATENCFVSIWGISTANRTVSINDVTVAGSNYITISSTKYYSIAFSTLLKAGDVIKTNGNVRYLITGLKR